MSEKTDKAGQNVLVTGGGGFIGSFLAEKILERGDSVHILDDFSTGRKENIDHLSSCSRVTITQGSILNEELLEGIIKEVDVIYHLAAAVGVKYVVENPVLSICTNTRGTENVLKLASLHQKKVFIASSSEVYGRSTHIPFKEDGELVFGPTMVSRWSYACSKALDEFLGLAYWKERSLDVRIGRLFNISGPRQTGAYGMVIPRFITQAMGHEPITVYGDGTQKRTFTYVGDAVAYIINVTERKGTCGEIFNIGSSNTISINDLAEKIKKMVRSTSEIVFIPYEKTYEKGFEDMQNRIPDTTKLKRVCPEVKPLSLEELLQKTIECHYGNS